MGQINTAYAYANNEVAYVAWDIDGKIDGCLGFEVTRVYLNADGTVARRPDGTENRVEVRRMGSVQRPAQSALATSGHRCVAGAKA